MTGARVRLGIYRALSRLWRGETLMRAYMNRAFEDHVLAGRTVDVGGGHRPNYFDYFGVAADYSLETLDGAMTGIDFEKDALPHATGSVTTVICANVLEHVYNHRFLLSEMNRILADGGTLIGFVPFMIQYHPDPHDFFRYSAETLIRLLGETRFKNISIVGVGNGPFTVNFNNIVLSLPRPLRPLLYCVYASADALFVRMSPSARDRFPLGFVFTANK